MNLTPEEKKVGLENFRTAVGSEHVRADQLKETVSQGLSSAQGLGPQYYGYGDTVEKPVRLGIIGTGDEGGVLIGALNPRYVQVVAIADIRPYNVYRAFNGDKSSANARRHRKGLMNIYGWPTEEIARQHVKVYSDRYEEMLDDENVEAVIIALPLHLHAEASIKAMRKGKHVLCEKLMGHSVAECKEMARVAKETDKLLAVGHQRHYSVLYDNAVEVIKKGLIGDIHHIRAQWHRGNLPGNDSWQPPLPDAAMQEKLEELETKLTNAKESFEKAKQKRRDKLAKDLPDAERKLAAAVAKKDDAGEAKYHKRIEDLKGILEKVAKFDLQLERSAEEPESLPVQLDKLKSEAVLLSSKNGGVDQAEKAAAFATLAEKMEEYRVVREKHAVLLIAMDQLANVEKYETAVEMESHRILDAGLETRAKDYGYQDRMLTGDHKVTALEELIRWRLWNRTGGGLMAELGSHQLDASGIFISALAGKGKKVKPLSVSGVSGRHVFPHDRDIDDHVYCYFEYPGVDYDAEKHPEKKIVVSYSSINGNGHGGYGEIVMGTAGTMLLQRESDAMLFKGSSTEAYVSVAENKDKKTNKRHPFALTSGPPGSNAGRVGGLGLTAPISRGYTEEIEHWAWKIRNPESEVSLRCSPKVALADAVIALTTNIAMAEGKRIEFVPAWFEVDSDETPDDEKPNVNRSNYAV